MTHQACLRLTTHNNNKFMKCMMHWRIIALALVCFTNPLFVHAYTVGHAKVISASGQPLVVNIPLKNLLPNDVTQISAKISAPAQWQLAGLKPPVSIESFTVELLSSPINDPSQRLIKISSTERTQETVVDLLIEVVTASGVKPIQASVIVLPAATVSTPSSQSVKVQRGDTLWSIAEKYPTAGANVYQSLLALFQANPNAFIDKNMNLLRTGVTLKLPTAAEVLAINASTAQRIFNQHLQAFNAMRGGQVAQSKQVLPTAPNEPKSKGQIDVVVEKEVISVNEVRLASPDLATQQADQNTSAARQAIDEKARIQALQDILNAKGSVSTGSASNGSASNGSASKGSATNGSTSSSNASSSSSPTGQNATSQNAMSQNAQGINNQTPSVNATKSGANAIPAKSSVDAQSDVVTTIKNTFDPVRIWLINNSFIAAIILLAIITWLIAIFMKNASSRRAEDQLENANIPSDLQQQAFSEKLGAIDLNLNDDSKFTERKI